MPSAWFARTRMFSSPIARVSSTTPARPKQLRVVPGHRERLGHGAEPSPREPVGQPAQYSGVLFGHRGNARHHVLLDSS
jgi:hypothetical protein